MAKIITKDESRIYRILRFLGLHESADGDTQLELGEAGEMRNWQVTPQFHLRVRPGTATVQKFQGPVRGLWSGFVSGRSCTLCVADGGIWELGEPMRRIGDIWDGPTTMFGFGNKVYFLNGREYLVWDGAGFADTVEGYVPLVMTAMKPEGDGVTVENINRLTGRRRCRFSADGTATVYHLPEQALMKVDRVLTDGKEVTGWTADLQEGTVTFSEAPQTGDCNVEIRYTAVNSLRQQVEAMRFAEQFNGAADTRVFLYGDGSAKAIYCGVTEDGTPSAEYFPDLYEVLVGNENAPLTGMIKYYDRLISYKADGGAFSTRYELTTLADGTAVPGFLTVSINRQIGNTAMGQVRLVQNVPRTLWNGNLYDWVMASYATRDERNAKCISGRVQRTLERSRPEEVFCFDDDAKQEYYVFLRDEAGTVLVHNYAIDVWYRYTALPVCCAARMADGLYFGMTNGRVVRFDPALPNDDGQVIDAFFASGHMSFDRDDRRKHSSEIWVSLKPTDNAHLQVSARSDRGIQLGEKEISMGLSSFSGGNFARWSFSTSRSPQMTRLKLKVKKFVYYQLILKSCNRASDATVLAADIRVRYTGSAR